ncbi:hypothetical protein K438DRAFT_1944835 [Mycena galopus ATCC 62051]|nr:hypothetical protein K438DRAFT_1944835 [Mycena galopus ATCC 62051]
MMWLKLLAPLYSTRTVLALFSPGHPLAPLHSRSADANILLTEPNKSKGSLHPSTLEVLKWARKNNRCPTFHTFWINKGRKNNHNNICLELTLKEMLGITRRGLDIRKGEHGEDQGFYQS